MRIAVTGANAGIGLRATRTLAEAGHDVVAMCRSVDRGERALTELASRARKRVQVVPLDLSSRASIRAAANQVSSAGPVDALINNAAIFDLSMHAPQKSIDGQELFWATNHLGPTELTARLSPALAAASHPRVVFVASKGLITMPRIRLRRDALDAHGWFSPTRAYYHSKLAQVMTAITLAERHGDVVEVTCLRVPAVQVDADRIAQQPPLMRALYAPKRRMSMAPEVLADVYAHLVTDRPRGARGADVYVNEKRRTVAVPRYARDPEHREALWVLTNKAIGCPEWAWDAA